MTEAPESRGAAGPARPVVGIGVVVLEPGESGLRVLLVRRARPPRQGQWSLPGGKQELGETVRAAAVREVFEETGVEVEIAALLDVVDSIVPDPTAPAGPPAHHYTLVDFAARRLGGTPRPGDDAAEAVWADVDALAAYDLWTETERVIALARERLGGDAP